jgi:hypothetical protein
LGLHHAGAESNVTATRDPIEVYRESLANMPLANESQPPTIQRAEVWPYPDLRRLWLRVETSSFAALPNLEFAAFDPDDELVSYMLMIEIRQPYQSVTLHLRRPPRAGGRYRLEIVLSRDEHELDTRTLGFDLAYRDPQ